MIRRAGLTPNEKKSAVLRCKEIEMALHSLLMEVLNGKVYYSDMERVIAIANAVFKLREKFSKYPEPKRKVT